MELRHSELEPILATLSKPHAEAIKQRVRALNHTVRGRTKSRQKRKPDIRDVFRDFDVSRNSFPLNLSLTNVYFEYRNQVLVLARAVQHPTLWIRYEVMMFGADLQCKL